MRRVSYHISVCVLLSLVSQMFAMRHVVDMEKKNTARKPFMMEYMSAQGPLGGQYLPRKYQIQCLKERVEQMSKAVKKFSKIPGYKPFVTLYIGIAETQCKFTPILESKDSVVVASESLEKNFLELFPLILIKGEARQEFVAKKILLEMWERLVKIKIFILRNERCIDVGDGYNMKTRMTQVRKKQIEINEKFDRAEADHLERSLIPIKNAMLFREDKDVVFKKVEALYEEIELLLEDLAYKEHWVQKYAKLLLVRKLILNKDPEEKMRLLLQYENKLRMRNKESTEKLLM